MRANMQTLKAAAGGDATALTKVDETLASMRSGMDQLKQLHEQLFNSASQGLGPQQKARLAIAMLHHLGGPMRGGRHGNWRHRDAPAPTP